MTVIVETCRAIWAATPPAARGDLSANVVRAAVNSAISDGWAVRDLVEYVTRDLNLERLPAASVHKRLKHLPPAGSVTVPSTPIPPRFEDLGRDVDAVPPTPEYLAAREAYFGRTKGHLM